MTCLEPGATSMATLSETDPVSLTPYPARVQAFRDALIKEMPRVPSTLASLAKMHAMGTRDLILAYITWRARLIPAKLRTINPWLPSVDPGQFPRLEHDLRVFLRKVVAGEDLTPHLSDKVRTAGYVVPDSGVRFPKQDRDGVLIRYGFHHFHIAAASDDNPKGRGRYLLFAEVSETEFTLVAVSDHDALTPGSAESARFHGVCRAYLERDLKPGEGLMTNPVMSSGHSLVMRLFSDQCEAKIAQLDPQLDDPRFIVALWGGQPIERAGQPISLPTRPRFHWHFNDLVFGILELKTQVFFNVFRYFAR
jgi:hypothetical protein